MLDNYFTADYAQTLVCTGRAYQEMFTEIRKKIEVVASDGAFETDYALDEIYLDSSVITNKAKLLDILSQDLTDRGFLCTVTPILNSDGKEYLTLLISW